MNFADGRCYENDKIIFAFSLKIIFHYRAVHLNSSKNVHSRWLGSVFKNCSNMLLYVHYYVYECYRGNSTKYKYSCFQTNSSGGICRRRKRLFDVSGRFFAVVKVVTADLFIYESHTSAENNYWTLIREQLLLYFFFCLELYSEK